MRCSYCETSYSTDSPCHQMFRSVPPLRCLPFIFTNTFLLSWGSTLEIPQKLCHTVYLNPPSPFFHLNLPGPSVSCSFRIHSDRLSSGTRLRVHPFQPANDRCADGTTVKPYLQCDWCLSARSAFPSRRSFATSELVHNQPIRAAIAKLLAVSPA